MRLIFCTLAQLANFCFSELNTGFYLLLRNYLLYGRILLIFYLKQQKMLRKSESDNITKLRQEAVLKREKQGGQLTSLIIELLRADTNFKRVDGRNKFDHAEAIVDSFNRYVGKNMMGRSLEAAILMHDLPFVQEPQVFIRNKQDILSSFLPLFENENQFYAALAIANGMQRMEEQAEKLRSWYVGDCFDEYEGNATLSPEQKILLFRFFMRDSNHLTPEEMDIVNNILDGGLVVNHIHTDHKEIAQRNNKINNNIRETVEAIRQKWMIFQKTDEVDPIILFRALNGDPTLTQECIESSGLMKYRPPMAKIETILDVIHKTDLESIILKALEVVDNIRHPNTNKPISLWQDCMEMLHLYAPLVEAAGFKDLAIECNSVVYAYLNESPSSGIFESEEQKNQARTLYDQAVRLYSENKEKILHILSKYGVTDPALIDTLNPAVSSRLKSWGSYLEKLRNRKGNKNQEIPDMIGFQVIIPQDATVIQIGMMIQEINEALGGLGFNLGHTRVHDKPISNMMYSFNEHAKEQEYLKAALEEDNFESEHRASGYKAMHINWMRGGVGIELQIVRANDHQNNTIGTASHIKYKGEQGSNSSSNSSVRRFDNLGFRQAMISLRQRTMNLARLLAQQRVGLCPYSIAILAEHFQVDVPDLVRKEKDGF